jgi:hypothetical protein
MSARLFAGAIALGTLLTASAARAEGFSSKLELGPTYARLFDSSLVGGEVGFKVGGLVGRNGLYGGVDGMIGHLNGDLLMYAVRPGFTWEGRPGIVHGGITLNMVVTGVERATAREFMTGWGAGLSAFLTVDLLRREGHALYLGARMRAEILSGADASGNAPVLWGPSLALGWRYR